MYRLIIGKVPVVKYSDEKKLMTSVKENREKSPLTRAFLLGAANRI